ncbi:MAG TPA: FAD-dependent oxidoreductase [Actinomycetota bacterium]|nr:FAD-dependent oxidoreductase [Actinomycetota bacterium]
MGQDLVAIIVGSGAMGTATAPSFTERGRRVLLLEQSEIGHAKGSSGGPTRIFRLSYHHPDYVRMARLALAEWRDLEARAGERLLITTGGLDVGAGGRETASAVEAAGEHLEYLKPEAVRERWSALRFEPDAEIFLQEDGGVCMAERTVRAESRLAAEGGATILPHTKVERVTALGDRVEVNTEGSTYRAPVAVVAAGPWAGGFLADAGLPIPLTPSFEQVSYFALDEPSPLPTLIDWTVDRVQTPYVVPNPEGPGHFKVSVHKSGPAVNPDERSFDPDPDRVARVTDYTGAHFAPHRPTGATDTCLYTNTRMRTSCWIGGDRSSSARRAAATGSSSRRSSGGSWPTSPWATARRSRSIGSPRPGRR